MLIISAAYWLAALLLIQSTGCFSLTEKPRDTTDYIYSLTPSIEDGYYRAPESVTEKTRSLIHKPNTNIYIESKITAFLWLYGTWFNFVLGTCGNFLCLMVLRRGTLSGNASGLYLQVLAATDLACVWVGLGARHIIRATTGKDPPSLYGWYCKLWYYAITLLMCYNHWVLAGVSVERCIAIAFPLKSLHIIRKKYGQIYLSAALLCSALYLTHSFKSSILVDINDSLICTVNVNNYFSREIKPWSDFLLVHIIPAVFICLCNGYLIYKLISQRFAKNKIEGNAKKTQESLHSVVRMLTVVSVLFLILTSPSHINYVIHTAFYVKYENQTHKAAVEGMSWAIAASLVYLSHASNFIFYMLSGKEFRKEFKEMICGVLRRKNEATSRDKPTSYKVPSETL